MALKPIGHNAQVQRLTTALKNICRDYPAGGTVLRELLQNADDAGATEVQFFLDERTYECRCPMEELIDPKLEQYQGPALLAYNNAIFTDKDFLNLSRLGDSLKLHDGSTTGKFGRGFNSVYNWTDSPSIVSRERFLILDPHCEWSEGGPVYDFVDNYEKVQMKQQMAAFQTLMKRSDQRLDGTIIRIPLRTQAQAIKSEISNRETTVSEVLEVLQTFASEFADSGLLFMRNVEKLEIGSSGISIVIEMVDGKTLRSHKSRVNDAVKRALEDPEYLFNHSFEAGIEYRSDGESKTTRFVVHHSIQRSPIDSGLQDWIKDEKLLPWVAVAAQLPIQSSETVKGSLFTVLPLLIATSQPIRIHGLFSLSPDRARLHQFNDKSTQDQCPAKWNNWLLQGPVPIAWTKLLCYLADLYPHQPAFERWPQSIDDARDPLSHATEKVMEIIEKESLALWPSDVGYITSKDGLLGTSIESTALRDALREAKAPVVYVPQRLQHRAEDLFKDQVLCPQTFCHFVRSKAGQFKLWSEQTKLEILEYLLSKPTFANYGGLELFPFKDGIYRSVGERTAYVHRDKLEEDLFSLEDFCNLDLEKLSETAQRALKHGCEFSTIHPSIQHRSANCLRQYCMSTMFKNVAEDQDMVVLSEVSAATVLEVWDWILRRGISLLDKNVSCLWLLPMSNGHHRKVKPQSLSSQVYIAPVGEIGDLMWEFDVMSSVKLLPLLLHKGPTGLSPNSVSIITRNPYTMLKLFIKDASSMVLFLEWLHQTSPLVEDVADEIKIRIAELIAVHLPRTLTSSEHKVVVQAIRHLKIFQKISWKTVGGKMESTLTWTNLNSCSKSIGLLDGIIPVPEIDDAQFLIADWLSHSKILLEELKLAKCLGSVEIIQDHIIPAWTSEKASNWTSACKEEIAEFILGRFSSLSLEFQAKLRTLPMIPAARLNGKETSNFAFAAELIDPSVPELKDLCFDDEEMLPKESFFGKFNVALRGCGLKAEVDEALIENRIRCYANAKYPLLEVKERAQRLLKSVCRWTAPPEGQIGSDLRRLKWLPAVDLNGTMSLKSADDCRGRRDRLLVSSQLPILGISISTVWEARLGWRNILPSHILLLQLDFGIQEQSQEIVDAVLRYISQNGLTERLAGKLVSAACVLVRSGLFVTPSRAFRPPKASITGCDRLQPYVANVDNNFWQVHEDLLTRIGVGDQPHLSDLLKVQTILEAKLGLEESDVAVAIEILNIASKLPRDSLEGLKIVSESGEFYPIQDINFDDLGPFKSKQKFNLTHPDIPSRIIKKLGIGSLRERLIKGMLEIEDVDDEDEFDQRENVITRITDTLDRYPVETTFREYLANADDAKGASKISWLLDQRIHPTGKLLTREMEIFQGPALLVHNDGVFSDDDLKGFKNVGEGSKAHERGTIGQFGRGSQTMYHWTDVPMILSGRVLLILDPKQEVLPVNQIKGKRKPGVKLELSKLRSVCSDQLAPFEGLWGYTQGLDNYPGTIFRFPLRTGTTRSVLRTSKESLNSGEVCRLMDKYFHEARISLLFLRRIKSIDFSIHGNPDVGWSITRRPPVDEGDAKSFSELVICQFIRKTDIGARIIVKDKWWVAIEDLLAVAERPPDNPRRVMKNVECGFAALISSTVDSNDSNITPPRAIPPRFFKTLPLPILSDLPVHVHATFLLSGDRKSITLDEYGSPSNESEWNKYLLQKALPKLYLSFLDDILPQIRQGVFKFWPQEEPPKRSYAEHLCASFWKELPKSSQRLFPKAQPNTGLLQRRAAERFDISQAVFDFLPESQSDILAPLLMSLEANLVRNIPPQVARQLKKLSEVKSVAGPMLRQLFKSDRSRICLLKEMANPGLLDVLFGQLIPTDAEFKDLDGCYILPLADGSLAKLNFVDANDAQSTKYYVASEKESRLFEFASKYLVDSSTGTKLKHILESDKFNLSKLQLCHIGQLLEMRPEVSTPSPDADKWLTEFWEFWNKNSTHSLPSLNIDTLGVAIFRAIRDNVHIYATPEVFHRLAAVVEPLTGMHKQLCDKIPGLYRFDTKFMPKSLVDNEESFDNEASFYRFIRALRKLGSHAGIGTFVKTHLDLTHLKILQNLILLHVSNGILNRDPEHYPGLSADLKSIPLWPGFHTSSSEQLISSNDALIVVDDRLLVPWIKDSHRFVNPQFSRVSRKRYCLSKLEVQTLPVETLLKNYVLPLPSTISDLHWQHFQDFITALSTVDLSVKYSQTYQTIVSLLSQSRIAADGNRNLKKAYELYDQEDQIFVSAFRNQREARFLNDSIKIYRSFWLKVGLRNRVDGLDPADYILCLQAVKLRLEAADVSIDPYLDQDSRTVLSPLTASNTPRFGDNDWLAISQERVFLSRRVFNSEPEYRRYVMTTVATGQRLLRLSEIVSYEYVAVCWSQTAFVVYQPTREVLGKVPGNGRPKIDMVWRHLQHMKDNVQCLKHSQIRDFLADLNLTYDYLQDHIEESRVIPNVRNSAIWLNLNTSDPNCVLLDDIKSSWQGIDQLVLSSSCDAGPIKAVRPGLMRFEKLLRGLGCNSITHPTVTRPSSHPGRSMTKSLRQLRDEGKLIDITYQTEGKLIKAHRVVLAAISEKCARQFSGRWTMETEVINYDEDDDPDVYLSYHTLSTMVKYAYEDEIDWKEMEVSDSDDAGERAEKLDLLLDLHKGADCWLIPALASEVEAKILDAGKLFINLENVIQVKERADRAGARSVERMCSQFIQQNRDAVDKAHSGMPQ